MVKGTIPYKSWREMTHNLIRIIRLDMNEMEVLLCVDRATGIYYMQIIGWNQSEQAITAKRYREDFLLCREDIIRFIAAGGRLHGWVSNDAGL